MRLAFEAAGGRCAFTSEWDKYSRRTYSANFGVPEDDIFGDITKRSPETIPIHDVLVAGFPCQPFSLAGVSKKNSLGRAHGFACDAQGTLFFDIAQILDQHRPQAFLLENVKNLESHDKGRTYPVIKDVLERQLKYTIFPRVVDARRVLPQHRERIFIVGFRDSVAFDWDRALPPNEAPTLASILHGEEFEEPADSRFTDESGLPLDKYTLSPKLWRYLRDYAEKHRAKGNGFGYSVFGREQVARTLSARYHKDGSEILISRGPRKTPRRLTPRECARLMGFDARWIGRDFVLPSSVSDTQLYRQFGNSVAVPVVQCIAREMARHITPSARSGRRSTAARHR